MGLSIPLYFWFLLILKLIHRGHLRIKPMKVMPWHALNISERKLGFLIKTAIKRMYMSSLTLLGIKQEPASLCLGQKDINKIS